MGTVFEYVSGSDPVPITIIPSESHLSSFSPSSSSFFSLQGLGDFLSELAEMKFEKAEREREEWEMENYPEGEITEMINIYKERGVTEDDARTILHTMAKYRKMFVDHMMVMELDINPGDDSANPAKNGFVTFCSFIAFGSVPVICYAIMYGAGYDNKGGQFGLACLFTALTMFTLGAVQARITRQPIFKTGLSMMLNGSLAAAAAYLVGWGLEQAIGRGEC
jgi:VIT1/CCC1 family predicted Fe2+/Mn2+ transporter